MDKELTFEKVANLEATKLFKDLGYELKNADGIFLYIKDYDDCGDIVNEITVDIESLVIDIKGWYHSEPENTVNIIPLMYPIMKLLEELQVDIKDVYFKEIGDEDE